MKNASLSEIVSVGEKRAIVSALKKHAKKKKGRCQGPSMSAVAEELGLNRITLWRKMKQYGLRRRVLIDVRNGKAKP